MPCGVLFYICSMYSAGNASQTMRFTLYHVDAQDSDFDVSNSVFANLANTDTN